MDIPVSPVVEEILEVIKVIPQEQLSVFIVRQIVDVPVPHVLEEIVPLFDYSLVRIQQRTVEGIVDFPFHRSRSRF